MNVQIIKSSITAIELSHMSMEIDTERLLLDDYPGVEKDLAIRLVQGYYWRLHAEILKSSKNGKIHRDLQLRALDYAKWYAARRLATEMHDLVDRSTLFVLEDAEQTGWYKSDYFGYDNLEELMASIVDEQEERSSSWWDWTFIVKTLLPFAKSQSIDPNSLFRASLQVRKLRSIVPSARETLRALQANQISADKAREEIAWMLEKAADPHVSSSMLKEEMDKRKGKMINRKEPIQGKQYITPEGSLIVIPCKDNREAHLIEMALRNIVNINIGDAKELIQYLLGKIRGITNEEIKKLGL